MSEEQWEDKTHKIITIKAEMTEHQALALAQFLKRVSFQEVRANAIGDDETSAMLEGIQKIQEGLTDAGFNPR